MKTQNWLWWAIAAFVLVGACIAVFTAGKKVRLAKRHWIIGGIIAAVVGFIIGFCHGAEVYLTNSDGTIFPAPAWGDCTTTFSQLGTNCFAISDFNSANVVMWDVEASNWFDASGYRFVVQSSQTASNFVTGKGNTIAFESSTNARDWEADGLVVNKWFSADDCGTIQNYVRAVYTASGVLLSVDANSVGVNPPDDCLDSTVGGIKPQYYPGHPFFLRSRVLTAAPQTMAPASASTNASIDPSTVRTNGETVYSYPAAGDSSPKPMIPLIVFVVFLITVIALGIWFGFWCKRLLATPRNVDPNTPPPPPSDPSTNAPPSTP